MARALINSLSWAVADSPNGDLFFQDWAYEVYVDWEFAFTARQTRKLRKSSSLVGRPQKKAENPQLPCKKGLSGRGREVTDKKLNFNPQTHINVTHEI